MISDQELKDKINLVLAEEFELDEDDLLPSANLYEDLGLDSLDAVDMVVALEKAFGIKLSNEEEVRSVRTLEELYGLVAKLRDEQASQ